MTKKIFSLDYQSPLGTFLLIKVSNIKTYRKTVSKKFDPDYLIKLQSKHKYFFCGYFKIFIQ